MDKFLVDFSGFVWNRIIADLKLWQEKGKSFELEAKKYENHLNTLETKRKRIFEMREDSSYNKEEAYYLILFPKV